MADAEITRKMVCAMLSQAGYVFMVGGDGEEALGVIQRAPDSIDHPWSDLRQSNIGVGGQ